MANKVPDMVYECVVTLDGYTFDAFTRKETHTGTDGSTGMSVVGWMADSPPALRARMNTRLNPLEFLYFSVIVPVEQVKVGLLAEGRILEIGATRRE